MAYKTYKLVGVSFTNPPEFGGKSRQEILKKISETRNIITINLVPTKFANETTGELEPAIQCLDKQTRQLIGWVAKTDVPSLIHTDQMTGYIMFHKNTYYVEMYHILRPSTEQYRYIKDYCDQYDLPKPAYDVRAYAVFAKDHCLTNFPRK